MANDRFETVDLLKEAGVNVYAPDEFDVRDTAYIIGMDYDAKETYQAVGNSDINITFESMVLWNEGTVSYCEITANVEGESLYLYGKNENGETVGSFENVEKFIKENFTEGIVNKEEHDEKLEVFDGHIDMDELEKDPMMYADLPEPDIEAEIASRIPVKADVPEDMENKVGFDFSSTDYEKSFSSGFIPFEFRDGFDNNAVSAENRLSQEDVAVIRENYDPDFGMVLGIDTTRFDTGENGNIQVIDIPYDSAARVIKGNAEGDPKFDKENVEYIRAYKEFGEGFDIDGQEFKVVNVVTYEIKVKGEDVPYRNTFVADDTGIVRGTLYLQDKEGPFEVTATEYVAPLDNYSDMLALDRHDFTQKIEAGLPQFFTDFTAKMDDAIDKRRPLQETRLENFTKDKEAVRNIYNRVEMYREIQGSKIAKAEYRLDNTVKKLKTVFEDMSGKSPDSKEYKDLSNDYNRLKNNFIDNYFDYMKVAKSVEPEALNSLVNVIRDAYTDIKRKCDGQLLSIDSMFSHTFVDDYGKIIESSYREGIINNAPVSDMERFVLLCAGVSLKDDGFPVDRHSAAVIEGFNIDDISNDIDKSIRDKVEEYNEHASDIEKVHIDDDTGQVYTSTGFRVEPHLTPETNRNVDARPDEDRFNPDMVKEDMSKVPNYVRPVTYGPSDIYEKQSIREYAGSKIDKGNMTRGGLADRFLNKGVYGRAPESAVDSSSRRSPDTKKDSIAHLFSGEDEKYFKAVCKVIDNHLDADKSPRRKDVEREKNPYIEEMEKEEADKNDSVDDSQTDFSSQDFESESDEYRYEKKTAMPYGRTDSSKEVSISREKAAELRAEADKEANGDKALSDKLFNEKCENLKSELNDIKKDIEHFDKKMESFGDIPFKYKSSHSHYQIAKLEHDSAIRKYQEMGGAVGADYFIQKGVSKVEALAGRMDVYSSNIMNTVIINAFTNHSGDRSFKEVYRGEDGNYHSYSKISTVLGHFGNVFGNTIGQVFKVAAMGIDKTTRIFSDIEKNSKPDTDVHVKSDTENTIKPDTDAADSDDKMSPDDSTKEDTTVAEETADEVGRDSDDSEGALDIHDEENDDSFEKETEHDSEDTEIALDDNSDIEEKNTENLDTEISGEEKKDDTLPEDAIASEKEKDSTDNDGEDKGNLEKDTVETETEEIIDSIEADRDEESAEDDVDTDDYDDSDYEEVEDPALLDGQEVEDDYNGIDESAVRFGESDDNTDPIDLSDISETGTADQEDLIKEKENSLAVDAVASDFEENDNSSNMSIIQEISDEMVSFLNGDDDNEMLLNDIADAIADDTLTPEDLIDALSTAVMDTADDGVSEGAGDIIQEVANVLDGSPVDNIYDIIDSLSDKGLDAEDLIQLEGSIADSFETADFETDEYGEYMGYVFDSEGVYDGAAGDDFYFPDTIEDIEAVVGRELDNMDFPEDIGQEFAYDVEAGLPDSVDVGESYDDLDFDNNDYSDVYNNFDNYQDMDHFDNDIFDNPVYEQGIQNNADNMQPDAVEQSANEDFYNDIDSNSGSGVDIE
ncbi:hypothetical protein [Blautia producta]|uniref:hypothetical protein n=1 Tax=Blautia producta TaxID=33035 RepID=UPI003567198A